MIRYTLLLALLALAGCTNDGEEPRYPHSSRVMLVYMAGDNSLGGYVRPNLDAMRRGMASVPAGCRTITYVDTPGESPRLVEVTASGMTTLHTWPGPQNSAGAATVREVIGRVRTLAPADRYGLVLWSHGLAWMPSWATDYLTRSRARIGAIWPQTKWFGQDTGERPAAYLDTADLAAAIPNGMFDWILFDACFMASAETLYALREKAAKIISSPAEVIADGFPYEKIMPALLRSEPDLRAVCESYHRHYADDPRPAYRSATVSLVETSQLEALAAATASVISAALSADPEALAGMDLSRVQALDRYRRHFLFDAGSVVRELQARGRIPGSLAEVWRMELARTVVYEAHTPAMLNLPLDECCGVSMYVPAASYADLNAYYETLGWCVRCYPPDFRIER